MEDGRVLSYKCARCGTLQQDELRLKNALKDHMNSSKSAIEDRDLLVGFIVEFFRNKNGHTTLCNECFETVRKFADLNFEKIYKELLDKVYTQILD